MTVDQALVDLDDVAPDGIAVVERDGPGLHAVARFLDHDALPLALAGDGGEAMTFLWQGGTSSYVLSVFRDGRPVRRLVRADGEIVVDEGPALAIEAATGWSDEDGPGDDEAALFALATALTEEAVGSEAWGTRMASVHRRRRRWPDPFF
ncbi:MAG TPA: hypothetical protein VGO60_03150 [Iamia sp.]|nr:hypothetical protein [Iamia sp.]